MVVLSVFWFTMLFGATVVVSVWVGRKWEQANRWIDDELKKAGMEKPSRDS